MIEIVLVGIAVWYSIGLLAAGVGILLNWLDGRDIEGDDIIHALFIAVFGVFTLAIMIIGIWGEYVTPWIEDKLKGFRKKVFIRGRQQY